MSLFTDQITRLSISADTEPERPFLPAPNELKESLLLADRGYMDLAYSERVKDAGGDVLVRTQICNPTVSELWVDGRRQKLTTVVRAKQAMFQHPGRTLDMDATWRKPQVSLRLVCFALPAALGYVHLITTVDRKVASAETLAEIYRLL